MYIDRFVYLVVALMLAALGYGITDLYHAGSGGATAIVVLLVVIAFVAVPFGLASWATDHPLPVLFLGYFYCGMLLASFVHHDHRSGIFLIAPVFFVLGALPYVRSWRRAPAVVRLV